MWHIVIQFCKFYGRISEIQLGNAVYVAEEPIWNLICLNYLNFLSQNYNSIVPFTPVCKGIGFDF